MSWQPIETAPKDGTVVLCYRRIPGQFAYRFCYWGGTHWVDYHSDFEICTEHWQPLPEPPK